MKQFSAFQLALTFVGVFLGAGFVSGQEIWQFFACFGPFGFLGFAVAISLFTSSTLRSFVWYAQPDRKISAICSHSATVPRCAWCSTPCSICFSSVSWSL